MNKMTILKRNIIYISALWAFTILFLYFYCETNSFEVESGLIGGKEAETIAYQRMAAERLVQHNLSLREIFPEFKLFCLTRDDEFQEKIKHIELGNFSNARIEMPHYEEYKLNKNWYIFAGLSENVWYFLKFDGNVFRIDESDVCASNINFEYNSETFRFLYKIKE